MELLFINSGLATVLLVGIIYLIGWVEEYASKSNNKVDDILLPRIKKILWIIYFLIVAFLLCNGLGIKVPALTALVGMLAASISVAAGLVLKDQLATLKQFFRPSFRLYDQIKLKGKTYRLTAFEGTDAILMDDEGFELKIPMAKLDALSPERKPQRK